jgi:hypothetical protein
VLATKRGPQGNAGLIPTNDPSEAQRQVEAYCQSLVDVGAARWQISNAGYAELHMDNGEIYLLGEAGVTRLR